MQTPSGSIRRKDYACQPQAVDRPAGERAACASAAGADAPVRTAVRSGEFPGCSSPGDAKSSLGDVKSSLGDAKSSLGDAKSSLGDAKSSLGDAKSSLGDAESSLGDVSRRAAAGPP
jgi:hypothetical protein